MKKKTYFKRAVVLLAVLVVFAVLPLKLSALETLLTTTVPSEFSVELKIEGQGKVKIGDKTYCENAVIAVKRNEWSSFSIIPEDNSKLKSVFYNGEDVIQKLENNVLAVFCNKNSTLIVVFTENGKPPLTGDSSNCIGTISIWIFSATMLIIVILQKRKKNFERDAL